MMNKIFIDQIRAFNRFYTVILGLLDNHILESNFSLAEVRILYELYHSSGITAKEIMVMIDMDKGQLSRILKKLERQKLVTRKPSAEDGRAAILSLSKKGVSEFEILNKASHSQVVSMLKDLDYAEVNALVTHMKEIQRILT